MINQALFSSESVEWSTPQDVFDKLNQEFHFELDAAATPENAKCARYYTKSQDGLKNPWGGAVWCNPPYGREIGKWVRKAYESAHESGGVVVMLLPARTDTKWFHSYILHRAEVRFIEGRLKFGTAKTSAPFPSMVVIFRGAGANKSN